MKNITCIIVLLNLFPAVVQSQPGDSYVLLGQLYGTAQFGFPEKINGKVKEFRQLNFFPAVENGKVVKVRPLTTSDRLTAPSGRDYFEEYDTSGVVIKSGTLDENGKLMEYWDVDTDSGRIKKAYYYTNDKLVSEVVVTYAGNNISKFHYVMPGRDYAVRGVIIDCDNGGNRTKYKYYGASGFINLTTVFYYNSGNLPDSIRSYNVMGRSTIFFKYGYNEKGEKTSQYQKNFTDGDIRTYAFEYEYDKMGNYTKVIFIRDNKPLIYRERQIVYHE